LGPTHRHWALCVVVGAYSLPLGSTHRRDGFEEAVEGKVSWK